MKPSKILFIIVLLFSAYFAISQVSSDERNIDAKANTILLSQYQISKQAFDSAYAAFPDVPRGLLEAVSYHYTHFRHITSATPESCTGMPRVYGVMGLTLDGKGYFRNNLLTVAGLSGYDPEAIIENPIINVKAFAGAFSAIKNQPHITSPKPEDMLSVLMALSELNISNETAINDYTMNLYLFGILTFLNNPTYQEAFGFPAYSIELEKVFGAENLKIFNSKKVTISKGSVEGANRQLYKPSNTKTACPDYNFSNCTWVASPNHYTGWNGHTISAIAIHTVEGSYTSCVNYFQNTSANASTHYVVASNSSYGGQITQMVDETNAAWHVTTENYYAIGYEHEGFVDDASWYTTTMYQTSAALTRDICNDHNINPLRMFYRDTLDDGTALDYGTHDLGGEGTCIKIKGHQHFSNQSHTDPGPNWTWDYYFKLVNDNPAVTTLTTATGAFYDSGGAGANYANDERLVWTIQPAGATSVTLNFSSFAVEANYDFMYIYDGPSIWSPKIGRFNTISPGTITSSGGSLTIEFRSDCATTGAGWVASWTSVQPDTIAPTTAISSPNNWKTADFTATFTDADNIGVEKAFYQVIDFDGMYWKANAGKGFFKDNFDIIQPFWATGTGIWNVVGNELVQTDETQNNSNIYAPLNQNLSNRYLYQFNAKVEGTGTNRRFGFHLFCDDGSQTNRGNSYFVWFRVEGQTLEFYKVTGNAFTTASKVISNVITTPGQYYDYKITYDRTTGTITVWRNNNFMGSWTDTIPYTTNGNYISFRSGNSKLTVSDLNVFRSRLPTTVITLNDSTKDIRYQNPNPTIYGAKIKSIVVDANNNLSGIISHNLNIDWTVPSCVTVNDGIGNDIDTTGSMNTLAANWTASADINSGIARYWYAIGTTAGDTNVVTWTDNGLNTNVARGGLVLTDGQHYYFSIKAENGAGLTSTCSSDGVIADINTGISKNENEITVAAQPNPFNSKTILLFTTITEQRIRITLTDMLGQEILLSNSKFTTGTHNIEINAEMLHLSKGIYTLKLSSEKTSSSIRLIKY